MGVTGKGVSDGLDASHCAKSRFRGVSPALPELNADVTALAFGGFSLEVFHPGAGHTGDNITVWVPPDKVLFGACLIKPYPDAAFVVPGHGNWGGPELLKHTVGLCP